MLLLAIAGLAYAPSAAAQLIVDTTPHFSPTGIIEDGSFPVNIPDNDVLGVTVEIGEVPAISSVNQITVSMRHSFVGDLIVRILPPSGPAFTLFERAGLGSNPQFPEDGYPVNLGVNNFPAENPTEPFAYVFTPGGLSFPSVQGVLEDGSLEILQPAEGYAAETWPNGPFPAGTWSIFAADVIENDTGLIAGVSVDYTAVPEPAGISVTVAGLLAAAALVRLRQRRKVAEQTLNGQPRNRLTGPAGTVHV